MKAQIRRERTKKSTPKGESKWPTASSIINAFPKILLPIHNQKNSYKSQQQNRELEQLRNQEVRGTVVVGKRTLRDTRACRLPWKTGLKFETSVLCKNIPPNHPKKIQQQVIAHSPDSNSIKSQGPRSPFSVAQRRRKKRTSNARWRKLNTTPGYKI